MTDGLAAATLAIYVILAFPVIFLLVKHGKQGLLGWLFLFIFCSLRIISGALSMKASSGGTASIISNVGLSPLLLTVAGILHEARVNRVKGLNQAAEWLLALLYHFLVVAGVALTAAGSSNLQHPDEHPYEKSLRLVKTGMAIMAISWFGLVGWAGSTFIQPRAQDDDFSHAGSPRAGSVLLNSVCCALVLIGVRVFYSVAAVSSQAAYLNPTTGALPIRVVLSFLPELIVTLVLIFAGFKTIGMLNGASSRKAYEGRAAI